MPERLIKYRGIPYLSKGRETEGLDCWGLIYLVYKRELNRNIPSWDNRYKDAHKVDLDKKVKQYEGDAFDHWEPVQGRPDLFDIALFKCAGNFHVGLCVGDRGINMLHITEGNSVCIERVNSVQWKRRFQGWYRWKN